jgi:hypothetical protein
MNNFSRIAKNNVCSSKTGLTLMELLFTAAILAFVFTGLLLLFINCILLNESNRHLTIATGHGQYLLEEIENENTIASIKANITSGTWNWTTTDIVNKGLLALTNESIATCCCDSPSGTCLSSCPDGRLVNITVNVNWKDRRSRDRNATFTTSILKR